MGGEGDRDLNKDIKLILSSKGGPSEKLGTDSQCVLLLSLYIFFSSLSSFLMKETVPLKNWGGTVVGQSEVALSSYKRGKGHAEMLVGCGDRLMNLINSFS